MSTENKKNSSDNNEPSAELIQAFAMAGEAIEAAHADSDRAGVEAILKANDAAIKSGLNTLKDVGGAAVDFAIDAGTAIKDAGIEMGSNWKDSLLENNSVAMLLKDKGPNIDPQKLGEAMVNVEKFSLEQQKQQGSLDFNVARTTFHFTTTQPICTANAILRCSCGLAFGPLKVLPINRVQLGTPPNPVATITDCIPFEVNIPQFVLCFNILNPLVLAATTAATIAKGGVFTLTPVPCFAGMAPSPWIPTTKNTCGKIPLLTQTSTSMCWGMGTINILHCGQGLLPGIANRFYVPGDVLATIKGYAESLVNLAGGLGAFSGVATKLAGPVGKVLTKVKLDKVGQFIGKYGKDGIELLGNATTGVISALEGDTGDAISIATDLGLSLIGKKRGNAKVPNAQKKWNHAQNDLSTSSKKRIETSDDLSKLKGADSPQAQANTRFNNAETAQASANRDLAMAKGEQAKANKNLNDAQTAQKKAQKDLDSAQTKQTKAQKDLDTAKDAQTKANKDVETAKTKQREANKDVETKTKAQEKANQELDDAKKQRDDVYNNPDSTRKQKADADKAVADAEATKSHADADLETAKQNKIKANNKMDSANAQKTKADQDMSKAQQNKQQADLDVADAHLNKAEADMNVTTAKGDKQLADQDVTTKKGQKEAADKEHAAAKENKAQEDAKVKKAEAEANKAKAEEKRAQEKVNKAEYELAHIDDKHPVADFGKGVAKPVALKTEGNAIDNYRHKDEPKEDYDQYLALLNDI